MAENAEAVIEIENKSLLSYVHEHISKVDQSLRASDSLYKAEFHVDCDENWIQIKIIVSKHALVRYSMTFTLRDWSDFLELKSITSAMVDKWCHVWTSTDVLESGLESGSEQN